MTDNVTENIQEIEELDSVAIRFAGDSGDGMQLTGDPVHEYVGGVRQ